MQIAQRLSSEILTRDLYVDCIRMINTSVHASLHILEKKITAMTKKIHLFLMFQTYKTSAYHRFSPVLCPHQ